MKIFDFIVEEKFHLCWGLIYKGGLIILWPNAEDDESYSSDYMHMPFNLLNVHIDSVKVKTCLIFLSLVIKKFVQSDRMLI